MNEWRAPREEYKLEQYVLEDMMLEKKWQDIAYVAPPTGLHTYPKCYDKYDQDVLSIHLAGFSDKVPPAARFAEASWFSKQDDLAIVSNWAPPAEILPDEPLKEKLPELLQVAKAVNAKARNGDVQFRSSYQCLGKPNEYEAIQKRSCVFRNVCYNKVAKNYEYYLPEKEPVFYDSKRGPIYTFNDGIHAFIQVTAYTFFDYTVRYFSPTVVYEKPDLEKTVRLSRRHALWSLFAPDFNMGHMVFEEIASLYLTMKRFGIVDDDVKILNMHADFKESLYKKFRDSVIPVISRNGTQQMDEYLDSFEEQYVCFDELIVASGSPAFRSMHALSSEGKEVIWSDFRNDIVNYYGIEPTFRPTKNRILLLHKTESVNSQRAGRTHFRDIFNIKEVHERLQEAFPDIEVAVYNPSAFSFAEQVAQITNCTILVTPPGGMAMVAPFLPHGSHLIVLDYYSGGEPELDYTKGESVSMEAAFWNLLPWIRKHYYQAMQFSDLVLDVPGESDRRWFYSVIVDLDRIEYFVNVAIAEMRLQFPDII